MNDNGGAMVNPESQMVNGSCTFHFVSCDLVDRFSLSVRGFFFCLRLIHAEENQKGTEHAQRNRSTKSH
jgi:hypothetical protein